jgi:hypothetical protein
VLAHRCTWDVASLVAVHNLGNEACEVPLVVDGCDEGDRLVDLLHGDELDLGRRGRVTVTMEGYGYRWLRVVREGSRRLV